MIVITLLNELMTLHMPTSDLPDPRAARTARLRARMRELGIDALIVPSSDPHLSEYLPARWQGRQWLSGFTGSVGTFIATAQFAGVWTDGRYFTQAEAELAGSDVHLMKLASGAGTQYIDWLAAQMAPGQTVAVDGAVLGLATARLLADALGARGVLLRTDLDLLDAVWDQRPAVPLAPVFEHLPPHAATGRADKLAALRAEMARLGADCHVISTLDDIAYLFNLRGGDVSYNPVLLAHALVEPQQVRLFVADGKIDAALRARLQDDGVTLAPYADAAAALAALPPASRVLLDARRVTFGMRAALPSSATVIEAINPTTYAKSKKTAAEIAHVRATMEQDGAALCEFFAWLEMRLAERAAVALTELDIDIALTAARARRPGFVGASFATIAGFNANGAIIHYRASLQAHARILADGLLLIDSGGQYLGGTTDITRMVAVGTPSAAQRRDCTLVLAGVIALSAARFPRGTRGPMLDALARAPIWAAGLDYAHGTGHGVGYFLNVHEGPQGISASAMPEPHMAIEPGMITSIEPGIYRPGQWGVRIENLVHSDAAEVSEFGQFLAFETLTLCPIDRRCLAAELLRADQIAWLNDYHAGVRARLAPHLTGAALRWLEQHTAPL